MKKNDPVIIGVIILTTIMISAIIFAATKQQGAPIRSYAIQDNDRPQLEIEKTDFNFGKMKLSETKVQEISLNNKGTKPLVIYEALTSCDCTFVQFVINGQESPMFSMQRDIRWQGELQSNEKALLKIIYQPSLMPVKGFVKREIVFKTNDPEKPLMNLSFKAEVE